MKTKCIPVTIKPLLLFIFVLVLLLRGHGYGYDKWRAPPGQPEQMSSKVDYDPNLSDRFFESDEWICPRGSRAPVSCPDGKPVLILNDPCNRLVPETCLELKEWNCPDGCKECATCRDGRPVVKNTARCYATSFGVKHAVSFCEARLLDAHMIDLFIHESRVAFHDFLRVRIRNGQFTCQYWDLEGPGAVTWTTTRQHLALDKKEYRKGDVIKGRIDFECLGEWNPERTKKYGKEPRTIKVFGVFKTILE